MNQIMILIMEILGMMIIWKMLKRRF